MQRFVYGALLAVIAWFALAASAPALATTKGLNQIVTPDIQPAGALSLSIQDQDPNIGNRQELQFELGLTKNFEVAVFQGDSPAEQIGNVELGLYQHGPWLLSTGFLNWTTKGTAPQPFLEGGFYQGNLELIAGAIQVVAEGPGVGGSIRDFRQTQSVLGVAYRTGSHMQLQVDYQSGSGNFSTAGFTYAITPSLSFNPSLYISNSAPTKGYGYAVLSWTIQAFKVKGSPPANSQPAQPSSTPPGPIPPSQGEQKASG